MLSYFRLQLQLNNRKLKDAGVPPIAGYLLMATAFIAVSLFLFYKTEYAPYIYPVLALAFINPLTEARRNEFLKMCYGDTYYREIRMLENLAIALPFVVFLLLKLQFVMALVLVVLSALWAFGNFTTPLHFTIPTPFSRRPYEFTAGFRNTFYLIAVAYALAVIAIMVLNFNLGIFAMLLVYAITLSYYQLPEPGYFVWSHSVTPAQFLFGKMRDAILYATVLTLPMAIALAFFFTNDALVAFGVMLLGYVYLCCMIAARYSAHPNEISIPQGILLTLCIVMPPTIIFILPYFIHSSINRLRPILK